MVRERSQKQSSDKRQKKKRPPTKQQINDKKGTNRSKPTSKATNRNAHPKNKKRKPNPDSKKTKNVTRHKDKNPVYTLLFNIVFYGFILFMIAGSIIFATTKNADKSVLGYRFFGVLTDSMVPRNPEKQKGGFHSGDVIIVKNIAGEAAEVGDIITFRPSIKSQAFLTHRVKKKLDHLGETKGTYYITQGDANLAEDVPVNEKQVVGKKILVIPKIGAFLNFVRENPFVSIIFLISVFGFITIIRYYILNK
ncbi:signal peptidase I [Enterococcus haemoperoxidus ATCC BAA-382]|uniref:Signal peptidase I n=1 Tax=Enterococcus haemoperoxidus ATCC BAA-382 TaxID=1158608 RepID=R2T5E5_9ENTE|nr:signal peptidase I [Enterococcus haemoperoxidus]EOI00254.1 signal peptidase I [Enterococcus haemoperoxidus ATCC BAA-382]EOT59656.1 signal peptidase I [Enterococcus haemoperoxidus ATCC BAA-382]OJG53090.1 signal peptidase I [Enterococcus haemoperoxidus]